MRPGISGASLSGKVATLPMIETGLLIFSAALFSLSFPSEISLDGIPVLAWFCLVPALLVINTASWPRLFVYGPLWGAASYGLFNYWLGAYHPLGLLLGMTVHAVWYLILVLLLRLARHLFPRQGFWIQAGIWLSYEYLRIQGFLAYPYGNLAYSQFEVDWLRMSSGLWGIWGVGLILFIPGACMAWALQGLMRQGKEVQGKEVQIKGRASGLTGFVPIGAFWLALVLVAVIFSSSREQDFSRDPVRKMILVQQNMDPLIGGMEAYRESLVRLMRQTRAGLDAHPDTDMVVWAETSFIPAIEWHDRFRKDPEKYELVQDLKRFSQGINRPLVLGNGEGVPYTDADGTLRRRDYNAVLVMENGQVTQHYRKNRLIPFTEYFPWREQFPWLHKLLLESGSSFWEPGNGFNLLHAAGISFGTPICYEDSFPDISRKFADLGAGLLVNLSNDSWSKSVPGAMQHLAMASFRASENGIAMARSTNGGMSVLIDPAGKIRAMNQPFTESWLYVEAPLHRHAPPVPARFVAELPAVVILLLSLAALLAGLVRKIAIRAGRPINR